MEEVAISLSLAVGSTLLLAVPTAAIYVFRASPAAKQRRLERAGLRGPRPCFPLGNIDEMRRKNVDEARAAVGSPTISHDIHSAAFPFFSRWRESYGKVFVYWLGTEPFLYVADPEFLRRATAGALGKNWGKPDVFKYDRRAMFGEGLLMSEGDQWSRHRQIITPAFSPANLSAMVNTMAESTSTMIEEWSGLLAAGYGEINVEEHITRNAGEIIAKTSFGMSSEKAKQVFDKLRELQFVLFQTKRLVGVPFSKLLHLRQTLAARALGKEIDELLLSIIESRKAAMERAAASGAGPLQQQDLLGLLIAGEQLGRGDEDDHHLVGECKTFFFAGHETTALTLTWTLLLLAVHPEWQSILRDEIGVVFSGRPLDAALFPQLTKMQWVLNESLRLYPTAPNAQRQAREDIRVGDVVVPKGTNMWVDVVAMHHDPALWGDDVNEFRPERFAGADQYCGGCRHRMGFLPFGFGRRICVGRNLTMLEYKVVLSQILRRFSLSVSPEYVHTPSYMLSLRPAHGVPLILTPV